MGPWAPRPMGTKLSQWRCVFRATPIRVPCSINSATRAGTVVYDQHAGIYSWMLFSFFSHVPYYSTGTPHMRFPFFYGCSSYLWMGGDDQLLTTADHSDHADHFVRERQPCLKSANGQAAHGRTLKNVWKPPKIAYKRSCPRCLQTSKNQRKRWKPTLRRQITCKQYSHKTVLKPLKPYKPILIPWYNDQQ